ncbi:MAG TPA: GAF domain-containing protein, partial [Steroidobacteraceae bacterium]
MDVCSTLGQKDRAIDLCLDFLRHVGVEWSAHPKAEDAEREYKRVWSLLGGRAIEDLIDLPPMEDPASLATIDVLTKVYPAALQSDANLTSLLLCRAVSISLERGNCDASCFAYAQLGSLVGRHFGDYHAGFRFGQLGCQLVELRGLKRFAAGTYDVFGFFVVPWMKHVRASADLVRRAIETALASGDLTLAAYACDALSSVLFFAGEPLAEVQTEAERGLAFAEKLGFSLVVDFITPLHALVRTFRGLMPKFGCLDHGQFNELETEARLSSNGDLANAEVGYWMRKLQARFIAGDYSGAVEAASKVQHLPWITVGIIEEAEHHFYAALAHAAYCDGAPRSESPLHQEAIAAHHGQLQIWSKNCPENFENRATLVAAEIARLEGRALDAMELYEQAIRSARASGFVHNEALCNETAARFYAARGFEDIANLYLRRARYCYLRWGANGKVRQLEERNPQLKEEARVPGPTGSIATSNEQLDLATVIKVSQAVSGEMVLEKLIDTLMRTAIAQAGAGRGLLILSREAEWRIAAQAMTAGEAVIVELPDAPVSSAELPEMVLHYVLRCRESVILDDAAIEAVFAEDPYIRRTHARSILCLPLMNQAKLIGVLYLENNLTSRAFTPTRITVLKVLASQAAISLENARLYRDHHELHLQLAQANRVLSIGELSASIAHEINQPLSGIVVNASTGLRMLNADPPNVSGARDTLGRAIRDANRASDVINRLRLLFAKKEMQSEVVDFNEVIREVVALSLSEIERMRIELRTELEEDLPSARGDRIQLQQVILNLVRNASEAMINVQDWPRV